MEEYGMGTEMEDGDEASAKCKKSSIKYRVILFPELVNLLITVHYSLYALRILHCILHYMIVSFIHTCK